MRGIFEGHIRGHMGTMATDTTRLKDAVLIEGQGMCGEEQLADLAIKMCPTMRLWELPAGIVVCPGSTCSACCSFGVLGFPDIGGFAKG